LPSALPSPNVDTHLPDFAVSAAPLPATTLPTGFAALFFSALRAREGTGFAPTEADDFDFAAIFFGLATALAMTENNPQEMTRAMKRCAAYTTLSAAAQAAKPG
jgi:hypothetical protein